MEPEEENTRVTTSDRAINEVESAKLAVAPGVSDFKRSKLEREAKKNWDLFYKRNAVNFFKDRHWTSREFRALCPDVDFAIKHVILEAGCGVGNFIFPFLADFPTWTGYACDFSPRAVEFVKSHESFNADRLTAFVCDLTLTEGDTSLAQNLPDHVDGVVDFVSLIFVLSAVSPEKMQMVLANLWKALKPGGSVLIRDYGLHDHAQLRFDARNKIEDNFYVRQDGTRAYYFSLETLTDMFKSAGFEPHSDPVYVQRKTTNKKEHVNVDRIFVQGRFVKKVNENNDDVAPTSSEVNGTHVKNHSPETSSSQSQSQPKQQQQQQPQLQPLRQPQHGSADLNMELSSPVNSSDMASYLSYVSSRLTIGLNYLLSQPCTTDQYKPLLHVHDCLKMLFKQLQKKRQLDIYNLDENLVDKLCDLVHLHWESRFKGCAELSSRIFEAMMQIQTPDSTVLSRYLVYYINDIPWYIKGRYRVLPAIIDRCAGADVLPFLPALKHQLTRALTFQHTATSTSDTVVSLCAKLPNDMHEFLIEMLTDTHGIRQALCIRYWLSALRRKQSAVLCEILGKIFLLIDPEKLKSSPANELPVDFDALCTLDIYERVDHVDNRLRWTRTERYIHALFCLFHALYEHDRHVVRSPQGRQISGWARQLMIGSRIPNIRLRAAECVIDEMMEQQNDVDDTDHEQDDDVRLFFVHNSDVEDGSFRQSLMRLLQLWLSHLLRRQISNGTFTINRLINLFLDRLTYDVSQQRLLVFCKLLDLKETMQLWQLSGPSNETKVRLRTALIWHVCHCTASELRRQLIDLVRRPIYGQYVALDHVGAMMHVVEEIKTSSKIYDCEHAQQLLELLHYSSAGKPDRVCTFCDLQLVKKIIDGTQQVVDDPLVAVSSGQCHAPLLLLASRLEYLAPVTKSKHDENDDDNSVVCPSDDAFNDDSRTFEDLFNSCREYVIACLGLAMHDDDDSHGLNTGAVMTNLIELTAEDENSTAGELWAMIWMTTTAAARICVRLALRKPDVLYMPCFELLFHILTSVTHKGVLDDCCALLRQLCQSSIKESSYRLDRLRLTLDEVIHSIATPDSTYSYCRDFALATVIEALIGALPDAASRESKVIDILDILLKAALNADLSRPGYVVACIKVITCMVTNSAYGQSVTDQLFECFRLSVTAFGSLCWPVRSAGSQLLDSHAKMFRWCVRTLADMVPTGHWRCQPLFCHGDHGRLTRLQHLTLYPVFSVLANLRLVHPRTQRRFSRVLRVLRHSLWHLLAVTPDLRQTQLIVNTLAGITLPSDHATVADSLRNRLTTITDTSGHNRRRAIQLLIHRLSLCVDDQIPSEFPEYIGRASSVVHVALSTAGRSWNHQQQQQQQQQQHQQQQQQLPSLFSSDVPRRIVENERYFGISAACMALPIFARQCVEDLEQNCHDLTSLTRMAELLESFGSNSESELRRLATAHSLVVLVARISNRRLFDKLPVDLLCRLLLMAGHLLADDDVRCRQVVCALVGSADFQAEDPKRIGNMTPSMHWMCSRFTGIARRDPVEVLTHMIADVAIDLEELDVVWPTANTSSSYKLVATDFNVNAERSHFLNALRGQMRNCIDRIGHFVTDDHGIADVKELIRILIGYVETIGDALLRRVCVYDVDHLAPPSAWPILQRFLITVDVLHRLLHDFAYDRAGYAIQLSQRLTPVRKAYLLACESSNGNVVQ